MHCTLKCFSHQMSPYISLFVSFYIICVLFQNDEETKRSSTNEVIDHQAGKPDTEPLADSYSFITQSHHKSIGTLVTQPLLRLLSPHDHCLSLYPILFNLLVIIAVKTRSELKKNSNILCCLAWP